MGGHVAIVGAGQAGAALALRLRSRGYDGAITLFGDEPDPPYQRPPLSKAYLSGAWSAERLYLRPAGHWRDQSVRLCLAEAVTVIDPIGRLLQVGTEQVVWTKLAIVTGAAPRPKPAVLAGLRGIHEVRRIADVDALRQSFVAGRRLLVVGGGFIGLEAAAVASKAGLHVTVVEQAGRILERAVCVQTAEYLRALHEQHGVRIVAGSRIVRALGDGELCGVELDSGAVIRCDLALLGIGVQPRTSLAERAGIVCADGIVVDAYGRTSATDIWAAGDCANFPLHGQATRLENVQNAIEQAETVADDMVCDARPYAPVPWFWSDQYDVKLQIAGLNRGYDRVLMRADGRGHSHWYFREDRLLAVDSLNDARTFMAAKRLFERGHLPLRSQVSCPGFDPVSFMRASEKGIDTDVVNKQSVRTD